MGDVREGPDNEQTTVEVEQESRPLIGGVLSWRVIIVLIIGIFGMLYYQTVAGYDIRGFVFDTQLYYHQGLFATMALLMALSWIGQRAGISALQFSRGELIVIFAVLAPSWFVQQNGLSLHHSLPVLFGGLTWIAYTDPALGVPFLERLSEFVLPQDPGLFETAAVGGTVDWGAWLGPVIHWTLFWSLLVWMMICVAALVRRQWTDVENYQFPLLVPPLEMVTPDPETENPFGPMWRSGLFWTGVAISVAYVLFITVPRMFPGVYAGDLQMWDGWLLWPWGDPWAPLTPGIAFSPLVIGLAFIVLRLDILFGVWFLSLAFYGTRWLVDAMGMGEVAGLLWLYPTQQALGALTALAVISLWAARNDIRAMVRSALSQESRYDDSTEPLSGPVAVWGFVGALIVWLLLTRFFLHITIWFSLLILVIWLLASVGVARMRIQGGYMFQDAAFNPFPTITQTVGTRALGADTHIYGYGFYGAWSGSAGNNQGNAAFMGMYLEALKYADEAGINRRAMTKVIMGTFVLSVFLTFVYGLDVIHRFGGIEAMPAFQWATGNVQHWPAGFMDDYLANPEAALATVPALNSLWEIGFVGIGVGITAVLAYLTAVFTWWPLHPVAYAIVVASTWTLGNFWFAFLIAWAAKAAALRWFGVPTERKLRMVAIGMVVGISLGTAPIAFVSAVWDLPGWWYM